MVIGMDNEKRDTIRMFIGNFSVINLNNFKNLQKIIYYKILYVVYKLYVGQM